MKEVIKFARFYYELGYSLNEAITMAINIAREVEMSKYERWRFTTSNFNTMVQFTVL